MKLRATDVPERFTIARARESRNAMGGTAPLYTFPSGPDLVIIDGTDVSILTGRVRNWVAAHLTESSVEDAQALQTGDTIAIETQSGLAFNLLGEAPPAAEPPALAPSPETPVTIPTPDLPPIPDTREDWLARIDSAMLRQVPILAPVDENEELAAYAERVLIPLSLTVAEVAKEKVQLQAALDPLYTMTKPIADSWMPLIDAAEMTFTHAKGEASDTGLKVGDIAVLAEGEESPEAAALRVAQSHASQTPDV